MYRGAVVGRNLIEKIVQDGDFDCEEFNLDDPFDDPSLCTTAFLDILWQDEQGNSALMLAATENRILHVKGILTMSINSGKLWQVLDMQNCEGLTALQLAVRAGSETCAMLITRVAREYAKYRPRPKNANETTHEDEITFDLNDSVGNSETAEDALNQMFHSATVRRRLSGDAGQRRLNREKISNSLRTTNNAQHAADYLHMIKRSKSAHTRLVHQRTNSNDSATASSPPRTPPLAMPQDHGVLSTVGERLRNIFVRKPPVASPLTSSFPSEKLPSATATKDRLTQSMSFDRNRLTSGPYSGLDTRRIEEAELLRLPLHSSSDETDEIGTRPTPWMNQVSPPPPLSRSISSTIPPPPPSRQKSSGSIVPTINGVRLPPLSGFRRRTTSESRPEFSVIGDEPMPRAYRS
ncbi:unnamed protein product [Caenorhabditis auriculariae]|uniref:Uncharacterized protein n=1 Tax=Caenorhabditis auriculariae TaxID=2777116 RepID=A0A8S1HAR0_9PELO|nr:unnamed protein product [Caenorhabditis auriculariae]